VLFSTDASLMSSSEERGEGEGSGVSDSVVRHIQALLSDAGMCHLSDSVWSGSMPRWISLEYLAAGRGSRDTRGKVREVFRR
jgi:hypothetical protein